MLPMPAASEPIVTTQQKRFGWISLLLVAVYFAVSCSGLGRFGDNGARVTAACFFVLPPIGFVLGILSRRTWMGMIGLVVSSLLLIFLAGSLLWMIQYWKFERAHGLPFRL